MMPPSWIILRQYKSFTQLQIVNSRVTAAVQKRIRVWGVPEFRHGGIYVNGVDQNSQMSSGSRLTLKIFRL